MKYCCKCKLHIRGKQERCPLCGAPLGEGKHDDDCDFGDVFPVVPTFYQQYSMLIKTVLFFSIAVGIVTLAINRLVDPGHYWSIFVLVGIVCVLINFNVSLRRRDNILKIIFNQTMLMPVFALVWDFLTNWRGWSIDYVMPIMLVFTMVLMMIMAKVLNADIEDYLLYLLLNNLYALIPGILMLTGSVTVMYPSAICVTVSIIALSALAIFNGSKVVGEIKKRFHM